MLDEIGSDKPPRYEDFKRKSSEEQNCPKSTRTELLNLGQSQFGAIRRMYHELREKEAALQNVEDPHMRAELEREFEEESASTKRHTIGVMRLIDKLFVWKMITLTILCVFYDQCSYFPKTPFLYPWSLFAHAKRDCLALNFSIARRSLS
ncbi:hypothetical protein T01_13887 [Trichinella spiralis]|uniref:Uncharacterized protein n=1 Tax=Trichinella spiralis TaxID=6334 RepID=A0A0V1ALD1_TRISP|nr:hypothetical protein T01_13887 [Trichinella spiralis]